MGNRNKQVDNYILKAGDFAIPVLTHLRELVHAACPEVVETIKWSFPVFEYKGMLCNMAAFKHHCAFGFWKAALLKNLSHTAHPTREKAMGQLGKIRSLADLPPDRTLIRLVKEAVRLNETGVKLEKKAPERKVLVVPPDFLKALKTDTKALKTFSSFSYANQKEYVGWILEAKAAATRTRRIATALVWLAEGKVRNWKYIRK